MRKIITIFIIFISAFSFAQSQDYISVDEIKEGMTGYGYTIVQGTNISKFDVTVISVMRKSRGSKDAILIRLEGDYFKHTGVAAGMSGSPIYIEDRLAGALAFGWSFSKDPIVGVTPIADMYPLYNITDAESMNTSGGFQSTAGGQNYNSIPLPLIFSGFSELSMKWYNDSYLKLGFYPMSGGGSANITNGAAEFFDGDGAAIVLVDGDISIAAVGTTTTASKDKFLLFGHGMFGKGLLKAPVAKAYINSIIPSTMISFKIGTPTYYVGYTTYDSMFGVAGVYGDIPKDMMIPVSLSLENTVATGLNKTINFRVINDSEYFSQMLSQAIISSLGSYAGNESGTFTISYEIETDYYDKPISMETRVVSFKSVESYRTLISEILSPIDFMLFNRFKPVGVKNIKIKLSHDKLNFAFIEDISLVGNIAYAGEKAYVKVGITEYGKEKTYKIVSLDIPENTPSGIYILFVGNEYVYESVERMLMPSKYKIRNLDDVMKMYENKSSESSIKTWLYSSADALNFDGTVFTRLPSSHYGLMKKSATSELYPAFTDISKTVKTEYPVLGSQTLVIQIEGDS